MDHRTSDLWAERRDAARRTAEPLAVRMRPRTLDELVGQGHIVGHGRLLRRMIEADAITSLILHGPPGTGKTTLAEIIAGATRRRFVRENAASIGVKRIREIIDDAAHALGAGGPRTILFLDEIHRFSRAQQDVLLGDVERGILTLIGATTENPQFSVNAALVSRSTLFRLNPLSEADIAAVVRAAAADPERGLGGLDITLTDEAVRVWAIASEGDARRALTALEVAARSIAAREPGRPIRIDEATATDSIQQKIAVYDHTGDGHYDAASALIKSVRGSDPDAAVYWIAVMLNAGEDPRFIARRLAILASEDVGNADPRAIVIAEAAWSLCERIGMPECRITLAQLACYLALAPKSNASIAAIDAATRDVESARVRPVPMFLRDPNTSASSDLSDDGHAVGMREHRRSDAGRADRYAYSHDHGVGPFRIGWQDYLGVPATYYHPTNHGAERVLAERLREIRELRERLRAARPTHPPTHRPEDARDP